MTNWYMFAEDKDGYSHEVKVDPANMARQVRDLEAQGYSVTILDEDERIKMGLIAQQFSRLRSADTDC
ncbi:hypothetical protein [Actinoplanes sp. URMC 104]|uniref:hypothetical protein n=1 Tax=Actinoplanes sp. URMC 104 TaxID=3423409 RepID=UPI003F1C75C2